MHVQLHILFLALLAPLTLTAPTPQPNIARVALQPRQLLGGTSGTTGTTDTTGTTSTMGTTGTTSGVGSDISEGLGAATEGTRSR